MQMGRKTTVGIRAQPEVQGRQFQALRQMSVFTRFDVPMFTWRDGLQRQAVEWKRRPVMLRGGVCA